MQTTRLWMIALVGLIGCNVLVAAQAPKVIQGPKKIQVPDPKPKPGNGEGDNDLTRFLKSPRLATVREAESIEALPVEMIGGGLSSVSKVIERPVPIDPALVRELRDRVMQSRSYYGYGGACMFEPGLALRFHKGNSAVQVLVCFTCHEVLFETTSGRALGDKITFNEDVMRLLPVARKAFPDRRWVMLP